LLFVLGGAAAIHARQPRPVETRGLLRQPLFVAAAAYSVMAGIITISWRWPGLCALILHARAKQQHNQPEHPESLLDSTPQAHNLHIT